GTQLRLVPEERLEDLLPVPASELRHELPQSLLVEPLTAQPAQQLLAAVEWHVPLPLDGAIQTVPQGDREHHADEPEHGPDSEYAEHRQEQREQSENGDPDRPVPPRLPADELPDAREQVALAGEAVEHEVRGRRLDRKPDHAERPGELAEEREQHRG